MRSPSDVESVWFSRLQLPKRLPRPRSGAARPTALTRRRTKWLALAASAACLLGTRPATAAEPGWGFELAFRASVAVPAGNVSENSSLSQVVGLQFPLALDVGYRFGPYVFVGATGQYAFGTLGSLSCDPSASCSQSGGQVGAEVLLHPLGRPAIDPWFGLGFGFEWLILTESSGGQSLDLSLGGFDFLLVTAGVEFAVGPIRLGPFVGFTMGEYTHLTSGQVVTNKALHFWLSAGIKVTVFP